MWEAIKVWLAWCMFASIFLGGVWIILVEEEPLGLVLCCFTVGFLSTGGSRPNWGR